MLLNVTFYGKILNECEKSVNGCKLILIKFFNVNIFKFWRNDCIFSRNEHQKVHLPFVMQSPRSSNAVPNTTIKARVFISI